MALARHKEPKADRLEVRLTPATKSLLAHAARLRHTTLTEFLVSSAVKEAEGVLVSPRLFEIGSDAGWQALTVLLDAPHDIDANPALVELLREADGTSG